jgi:uncharacterized membrane protein YkoI
MNLRRRWLVGGALGLALLGGSVGMVLAADPDDADDQVPAGADRTEAEGAALEATGGGTITSVEAGDDGSAFEVEVVVDNGEEVEVNLDSSFDVIGTESEGSDDDSDGSGSDDLAPGAEHDRAIAAALAHTEGGTVTEVEVGDDGAAYGVEVLREDGVEVEVELDEAFAVIGSEVDD